VPPLPFLEHVSLSQPANLSNSLALQVAIALATHDADNASPDGHAGYIEVWPDHFQRVIERRRIFVKDTNDIRNMTLEERALMEGLRRDRNLKLGFL
jgi:hypothetical protein